MVAGSGTLNKKFKTDRQPVMTSCLSDQYINYYCIYTTSTWRSHCQRWPRVSHHHHCGVMVAVSLSSLCCLGTGQHHLVIIVLWPPPPRRSRRHHVAMALATCISSSFSSSLHCGGHGGHTVVIVAAWTCWHPCHLFVVVAWTQCHPRPCERMDMVSLSSCRHGTGHVHLVVVIVAVLS